MKTLKQQIAAINSALRTFKKFEMDEGMPGDGLRDAATTLIALELIARNRDSFLFGFATKLTRKFTGNATYLQFVSPRQAYEISAVLEVYLVERGLLPPIDRPHDNSDRINDAFRYSSYGLRCFNCNGTGIVKGDNRGYCETCSTCGGTGVPKEGNAGYGFVDTKTTPGLKRPYDNGQAAVQASNVAEAIRSMKRPVLKKGDVVYLHGKPKVVRSLEAMATWTGGYMVALEGTKRKYAITNFKGFEKWKK